jgi:hypothetical protein
MNVPLLCLSKRGAPSPTWPKKVPLPDKDDPDGCTDRWDSLFPDDTTQWDKMVEQVTAMVEPVKPSKTGPKGEAVTVKRLKGPIVEVAVTRAGKRIARGFFELKFDDMAVPNQIEVHWRADGGAVAVAAGYKPDPRAPGFGPPTFVIVAPLDGSTADTAPPLSKRQRAQAFNVEGLKLASAKQLDKAQEKFEAAVEADDDFALASYNLACTASLRKDKQTSMTALRQLAVLAGTDPVAKQALAKGLTDHDLDWISSTDPDAAKLLKRKK